MTGVCVREGCDRPTCRPPEYEPLCSRHYLADMKALLADRQVVRPTDEQLLAFEGAHDRHTSRKETAIRAQLGITPARYYQLLGRLIWLEDALRIDPMLTNRLRRRSVDRQAKRTRPSHGGPDWKETRHDRTAHS